MICGFYKLCQDGNADELREKLDKLPKPAVQNCQPVSAVSGTVVHIRIPKILYEDFILLQQGHTNTHPYLQ